VKGGSYVVDDCSDTDSFVAAGVGDQLHDGRVYSPPDCGCRCRDSDPIYSGTRIAIWTLAGEGEVFGKKVVSRSRKILPNLTIPSVEKVS
jgi:hypothetical protein